MSKILSSKIINTEDPDSIQSAERVLQNEELAVLPTDTVYGLAALGKSEKARANLLSLKPRPENRPIGFLISSPQDLDQLGIEQTPKSKDLVEKHWPGALTVIFRRLTNNKVEKNEAIPAAVEFGIDSVGLRCPDFEWLNKLISITGPLAVTSANLHNDPTPKDIQDLAPEISAGVGIIVSAGALPKAASTIIDLTQEKPQTIRRGELKL